MRYLGIDYGTKKIGLALSDEAGTMGFPHAIVATREAEKYIVSLVAKEGVTHIVMGESKNFKGEPNPVAKEAAQFGIKLAQITRLPIAFEPEHLTSAEARRQHEPTEKTRAPKERANVDSSAAALILTSYLSKHPN